MALHEKAFREYRYLAVAMYRYWRKNYNMQAADGYTHMDLMWN